MAISQAEAIKLPLDYFKRAREEVYVALTTIMITALASDEAAVKNSAGAIDQLTRSLSSTTVPAEVSGSLIGQHNVGVDLAVYLGTLLPAVSLAKASGSSPKELFGMAIGAEMLATSFDIGAAHDGLMDPAELAQKNSGSSAVAVAFFTKYLRHKIEHSETTREKLLYRAVLAAFIGSVTLGAAAIDSDNFVGNIVNHGAGALVGYNSEKLGELSSKVATSAQRVLPKIGRLSTRHATMPPPKHSSLA